MNLTMIRAGSGLDAPAGAGTVLLLGTDAVSLHDDSRFQTPIFGLLHGGSALPVLVVNNLGLSQASPLYEGMGPLDFVNTAAFDQASGPITGYAGLFFPSPGRCCFDAGHEVAHRGDDIAAFVDGGGNLAVEDYQGKATWDRTLHFAGLPGVLAGLGDTIDVDHPCVNPGVSTPLALSLMFDPTYAADDGCFGHQFYDVDFWTRHGFAALQQTPAGAPLTTGPAHVHSHSDQ